MLNLSRRAFLAASSLAAAPMPAWARDFSPGAFTHGVASGDPLPDRVVLWTRFAHASDGRIGWEIAEDEAFARVVTRGEAVASPATDYCVKGDAGGLAPGRPYFYRFLSASGPSVTGRTRTAPAQGADSLKVALFSCANMPFGYFHAYGDAAADDSIDLALHVGDYIYEMPRGAYPSTAETVAGRIIEPANELVTLASYYQRYASYHQDADLLELRRLKPMCVVWDDHEIANDAWREGAQNHQPETEGAFSDRAAAAAKAYFDWMPIRRPDAAGIRIYRSLDWGDLARIVLLDTRLIGRDQQLDYRGALGAALLQGDADAAALAGFRAQLNDPRRSLLGAAQEQWLAQMLQRSKDRGQPWQIVAQQIKVADHIGPAALAQFLPAGLAAQSRQYFDLGIAAGAAGLPWNLDSWSGYPAARTRLLQSLAANAGNAVMLGGDSHNCWIDNLALPGDASRLAGLEFAGGSVTSPGFERTLSAAAPGQREAAMRGANGDIAFCDVSNRGYGVLHFTRDACAAEWRAVGDIRSSARSAPNVTRLMAAASAAGPQRWSMV